MRPLHLRDLVVDGVPLRVLDESGVGEAYGGNKVRKLDRVLPEVEARGHRHILTMGAVGSHHVIATALAARSRGIATHALLLPQPDTPHVRANAHRIAALCASVTPVPRQREFPLRSAEAVAHIRRDHGERPYWIPAGGSSRLGTTGWVEVGHALRPVDVDVVVVAAGSGGTAAGLAAGLAGSSTPVVGVRVAPRLLINRARLATLATGARPTLDGTWYCGGYGRFDARVERVIDLARSAGLTCETTYTGKALGAALERARAGRRVLYVHTLSAWEPPDHAPLGPALEQLLLARPVRSS